MLPCSYERGVQPGHLDLVLPPVVANAIRQSLPIMDKKLRGDFLKHAILVGPEMRRLRKESLRVVLLDTRYQLVRVEEISLGTINESIAHPRDVLRPAVISSAYAIVVVHNHPSGDASPSQTDHSLTRRLAEAAELMQIKLLDHIIIGAATDGAPGYFSFKEAGVL